MMSNVCTIERHTYSMYMYIEYDVKCMYILRDIHILCTWTYLEYYSVTVQNWNSNCVVVTRQYEFGTT